MSQFSKKFMRKKGQPERIYFVRFYMISPNGYLPDSSMPCASLEDAKESSKYHTEEDIEGFKVYSIANVKESYFDYGSLLVVGQGDPGPVVTIEMLDDEQLIATWWNEERQEFEDDC